MRPDFDLLPSPLSHKRCRHRQPSYYTLFLLFPDASTSTSTTPCEKTPSPPRPLPAPPHPLIHPFTHETLARLRTPLPLFPPPPPSLPSHLNLMQPSLPHQTHRSLLAAAAAAAAVATSSSAPAGITSPLAASREFQRQVELALQAQKEAADVAKPPAFAILKDEENGDDDINVHDVEDENGVWRDDGRNPVRAGGGRTVHAPVVGSVGPW